MPPLGVIILYAIIGLVSVGSAVGLLVSRNAIYSALFLVLNFLTVALLYLVLGAPFIALAQITVYAGAIMVLFLFVIMMLDVNFDELRRHFRSYLPVGAAVGALVLLEMVLVILSGTPATPSGAPMPPGSNTAALGRLLYLDYVFAFELAAVLLLVAIVAAIALTWRRRRETKRQDPADQVKVRREDRVRLVTMPVERREGP